MKQILIILSLALPLVPPTILLPSNTLLGSIAMILTASLGLVGLIMNRLAIESWASLILMLVISLTSQGYVPYILHSSLTQIWNPALLNGLIVVIEYSLVSSQLYGNYVKYMRELSNRGYDKAEVNNALDNLVKWIMALLTIALTLSLAFYYVITMVTIPLADPFTALVVFAVTYIVITRYVITRIRSS
ncbi:hypothetical protein [Vulcanisaeta souniana]|uniref:Uncharacterized protein n=1 Tax=Vulcanisaeta souniana JCM 11219 TaxID=1293586 RepID=A0A830EI12_9CREN|nr:hypothetical protein [Vulcanisaeta souniana]BDR91294.1 hypothetical protein Vsou_03870 [Vulcanisaeta souniana JCM 11219]GGI84786.1 hypothetical protein GCM10007112_22200 [Vulcanisaeta souniana JCM 11219]